MAALAIPEEELWVNFSLNGEGRIIPQTLGNTDLGRDLLNQDYFLKELTASLTAPGTATGDKFWKRLFVMKQSQHGGSIDTLQRVWIVPDYASVYVSDNNVFIVDERLKVLSQEDYHGISTLRDSSMDILQKTVIPEIEREVNENRAFAPLRQIYNSVILASWFKQNLKNSLISDVYADRGQVNGINLKDKTVSQRIYERYVRALQKGAFATIREDYDTATQAIIPRKYFSGGALLNPKQNIRRTFDSSRFKNELAGSVKVAVHLDAAILGHEYDGSQANNPNALVSFQVGLDGQIEHRATVFPAGQSLADAVSSDRQGLMAIGRFNPPQSSLSIVTDESIGLITVDDYVAIRLIGEVPKIEQTIPVRELIDVMVEVGQHTTHKEVLENIAGILGQLSESYMSRANKLDVLLEILEESPANPAPHGPPNKTHVYKTVQQFALELKSYQENHPGIHRLKVGIFGVHDGRIAYLEMLNAKALGVGG